MKLRLKDLAFDKVNVEIVDDFRRADYPGGRHRAALASDFEGADVSFQFSARALNPENSPFPLEEGHYPFDVDLEVTAKPKSESQFPYCFAVMASGLFVLYEADGTTEDERLRFAQERGARPLLAAIREQVMNITSRSYWGTLLLPELNISLMVRRAYEQEARSARELSNNEAASA